ncbi:hypothetical protein EDC01DRAFT_612247, partial [Geopyxis carbonaria]
DIHDVSYWRNNLIAGSKRYNYLFIALRSEIRVYAPQYPYQKIPEKPLATLTSSPIVPSRGYIDAHHPHAINSLTIGDLGTEEVLVSAHDDGDVCVWYTRDLKRMALRLSVGQSAWGVALHQERRLLAVSANSHVITVFELAMAVDEDEVIEEVVSRKEGDVTFESIRRRKRPPESRDGDGSGESDEEPSECPAASASSSAGSKKRRKKSADTGAAAPVKDKAIKTLKGHENNIPSIAFLDDSSGRWLVGTSIDGTVILWDVKTERAVEKCKLGFMSRGWSVLLLKPQSFKAVRDIWETVGKSSDYTPRRNQLSFGGDPDMPPCPYISGVRTYSTGYYRQQRPLGPLNLEARAWDVTPDVVTAAFHRPAYVPAVADSEDEYSSEETDDEDPPEINVYLDPMVQYEELEDPAPPPPPLVTPDPIPNPAHAHLSHNITAHNTNAWQPPSEFDDDDDDDDDEDTYSEDDNENLAAPDTNSSYTDSDSDSDAPPPPPPLAPIDLSDLTTPSPSPSSHSSDSDSDSKPEPDPTTPPLSFIFTTTEHHAYLLPTTPVLTPSVQCRQFLHQPTPPPALQYLTNIDRLNMVHTIPELSLVISASQKGRVGLFRLTRCKDHFAMRLDAVLPREACDGGASDGRARDGAGDTVDVASRPSAALMGVSVAPLQAGQARGGKWRGAGHAGRRWRLMLVYTNGAVLSYELARDDGEEMAVAAGGSKTATAGIVGSGFVMI